MAGTNFKCPLKESRLHSRSAPQIPQTISARGPLRQLLEQSNITLSSKNFLAACSNITLV